MNKILIVEDSKVISKGLQRWITTDLDFPCDVAGSMLEAKELITAHPDAYFISLLDLHLPDAPNGEIVDFILSHNIPSVIVTGTFDEQTRKLMMSKDIVDYVVKSHPKDMPQLLKLIRRIHSNYHTKVLIVDDSRQYRRHYSRVLENQKLNVFLAEDGIEALSILEENKDIRLVLTDYHMPRMNGHELVQNIRNDFSEDNLAIIVFSTDDTDGIAPKFLKAGANDFISKTASREEFLCRINMNLDMIDMVYLIKDAANRDFLTKIFNRKYFFEHADKLYSKHKRDDRPLIVAMTDIDHFKNVNDIYGHLAGDMVIKQFAQMLKNKCGNKGIVARFGGEEFCILLDKLPDNGVVDFFENIRLTASSMSVFVDNKEIKFTVSIGVTSSLGNSLADMINISDQYLYHAKQNGRNSVCFAT